jgi:hypothetical protein
MKYLILSIILIVALVGIFFLTYFLNKKTPVPKGCENLRIGAEGCGGCNHTDCSIRNKIDFKKIEEDIKEDE